MAAPRVLVVDDEAEVRRTLALALQSLDCQVLEAESGERALQLIPEFRPDVVCLDLWMRGMSGLEVLEAIRRDHPGLPVVIVSADPFSDTVRDVRVRGAVGYLYKPFKLSDLSSVLDAALRRKPGP